MLYNIHLSCQFVTYLYLIFIFSPNCPVCPYYIHKRNNHLHVQTFPYFQVRSDFFFFPSWVTEADPLWISRADLAEYNLTCVLSQGLSILLPSVIWSFILNMHYSLHSIQLYLFRTFNSSDCLKATCLNPPASEKTSTVS